MKTELDKLIRIKQEVYHDEVLYTYMCELIEQKSKTHKFPKIKMAKCNCVIFKPIDPYHPENKDVCRDCGCELYKPLTNLKTYYNHE